MKYNRVIIDVFDDKPGFNITVYGFGPDGHGLDRLIVNRASPNILFEPDGHGLLQRIKQLLEIKDATIGA